MNGGHIAKLTARAGLLIGILLAILAAPAAAASWSAIGAGDLTPEDRATAAYGAVALPDGGYAWIEMVEPSEGWEGLVWTAEPQYWRVVRATAAGEIIWRSEEYSWQRAGITLGWWGSERGQPWYDPKILVLANGNLLAYDSVPQKSAFTGNAPGGTSPPRSWLREIDVETGGTVWEQDIVGWAITGLAERPEGGYWAAAVSGGAWTKGWTYYHATSPECSYILTLGAQGEVQAQWRIHAEPYRTHSSSHVFGMAPVAGSEGDYWVFGWKSIPEKVYDNRPYYDSRLRPQLDRIDPVNRTDAQYNPENFDFVDGGTVPRIGAGVILVQSYFWGLPTAPMRLAATSDGGALISYGDIGWGHSAYLTRMSAAGGVVWKLNPTSPISGAEIPVLDMVETADGSILALLQDGDAVRVSRLSSAGEVLESVLIGDPAGAVTGKRIVAAPSEGHPYGCVISGSTSGFGASGTDALVVRLDDLEDVIWLGSGSISLPSNVAYAAEEIEVTAALAGAAWGNATYWGSVIGENGTLYETWDLTTNESTHTLSIHTPPGNYTVKIQAYCEDYGISQTLAAAPIQRIDMGTVEWDRNTTYLGEQTAIGYSYVPDYLTYSYWIEIRDPSDTMVERHRLPTEGPIRPAPENLTEFGEYVAELFAIRKSDDHRIPGNVSTITLSDETWLYGRITDLHLLSISGARIEVQQPSHPDPEVAARVLSGTSDTAGDYEVSGIVPRYPAVVTVTADGYYEHEESIAINVSGRIHYPARLTPIPPPPLPEIGGTAVYPPRNHPAVGLAIVLENSTTTLIEVSDANGHYRFPPLAPDIQYSVFARNATGHRVSETHTYALSRGQTVDLLLEIVDESLLPYGISFTADPTSGPAPLRVTFQATGEDVETWHWDYGDGATGTGQTVSHTYGPGLWTVTLTAENYYGVREVTKERLISVSGSGGVPAVAPTRFVIQSYTGQALANVNVTATPLESTGPLSWLLDLFGISGDADINGTVLSGTTDSSGGIVLPLIRTVKYQIDIVDPSRGVNTTITTYPHEDEIVISVWPQETPSPAGDFQLYAEEEAGDMRVGVRWATVDLARLTFTVTTEGGVLVHRSTSAAQEDDLSYILDGDPGEVYLYGYVAEFETGEVVRQDQYVRFAAESRPWIDLAPWIPRGVYNWAAIFLLMGFSWTFGRGEIRGALLTIPILAGVLWLIGWLEVSWLLIGAILTLGILVYMRLSEDDLRY